MKFYIEYTQDYESAQRNVIIPLTEIFSQKKVLKAAKLIGQDLLPSRISTDKVSAYKNYNGEFQFIWEYAETVTQVKEKVFFIANFLNDKYDELERIAKIAKSFQEEIKEV